MKRTLLFTLLGLGLTAGVVCAQGAIYGTVYTDDGEVFTGVMRWDKNEAYWDNVLDATKDDRVRVSNEGGVDLRLFGIRIKSNEDGESWVHSQFSIPFGHLESIEPRRGNINRLAIKNGEVLEIRSSGDLGSSMRGVEIKTEADGAIEIDWSDIERVEFASNPGLDHDSDRLYGTVSTTVGDFTGAVVWDKDEALLEDILDGEERGRDRKIPFRDIESIERLSSKRCEITLATGRAMILDGSNDVNKDNRGIEITIPGLGKVETNWRQFVRADFTPAPPAPAYEEFDGGRRIHGSLTTADGSVYTGDIVWDQDETFTWEALDGEIDEVRFQILFENISRIEKGSDVTARVFLRGGLEMEMAESNDVTYENKGIRVIQASGDEVEIDWEAFDSVTFLHR